MKFKYYLRGFGAGLITSTIVIVIASQVNKNNSFVVDNPEPETTSSIIAYTKADETVSDEAGNEETSVEETKNEETSNEETKTANVTEKETEKTTVIESGDTVTLEFYNVYTAIMAAEILYDAGVIDDKEGFYMYMYYSGYDTKMHDGVYTFTKGDTFENIAKTIAQ